MTTVLLDSHLLKWWSSEPTKLSRAATAKIEATEELAIASMTWFELAWSPIGVVHRGCAHPFVVGTVGGRGPYHRHHARYCGNGRRSCRTSPCRPCPWSWVVVDRFRVRKARGATTGLWRATVCGTSGSR